MTSFADAPSPVKPFACRAGIAYDLATVRILVVEDDPATAAVIVDALNAKGHQATAYHHGGMALGAIVRGKFELLVCDIILPNIDGVATIRMIRGQFPYLPVIVVSGAERAEWEPRCREVGATAFLEKPLRIHDLLSEVKLVETSQVNLHVGILDSDTAHRQRLAETLSARGCTVKVLPDTGSLLAGGGGLTVLLVDAALGQADSAIAWARQNGVAAIAFGAEPPPLDQDKLLRLGASFCMSKPVDAEALVTQARFFVSPEHKRGLT